MNSIELMAKQCAAWVRRLGADDHTASDVAALASSLQKAVLQGHTCIFLTRDQRDWIVALGLASDGRPEASKPMVVDAEGRLYWQRYFVYESRLAEAIVGRTQRFPHQDDLLRIQAVLKEVIPKLQFDEAQHLAVALGVTRPLTLVSGGPGTGKTTLTVKLLEALLRLQPQTRIALAAPTGKAAHRMLQTIESRVEHWPESLKAGLPKHAETLHRLIGVEPHQARPRYHRDRRLPLDYLVIDEASMMDVALAAQVFDALPDECSVLLLGDKDQLAAVESGAVFAELTEAMAWSDKGGAMLESLMGGTWTASTEGFRDAVVFLTHQHRFSPESSVGRLATAIRDGQAEAALALLKAPACGDVSVKLEPPLKKRPSKSEMDRMAQGYESYWALLKDNPNVSSDELLKAFDGFRVLCALQVGPWGAKALGQTLDGLFRKLHGTADSPWYPGRPILMTRNDPALGLVNGDIGVTRRQASGELIVEFMSISGQVRAYVPGRLTHFDVAYAMTIHKSQGSEMDDLVVVLPFDDSELLTRELLYTAVTRARRSVTLIGQENRIESAIQSPMARSSGLRARVLEALKGHS